MVDAEEEHRFLQGVSMRLLDEDRMAGMSGKSHFLALLSRLKYIERWALMRNAREENLAEHSLDVAMIAHMLCVIGNVRYGRELDANRAALVGIYHDASEIITGDMPTPVKYANNDIRDAYKGVEAAAQQTLVSTLPEDLQPVIGNVFKVHEDSDDKYLHELVHAADKLAALVKCIEERESGSGDFVMAERSTRKKLEELAHRMPEVADFMDEFLPAYGKTLDELL